MRMEMDNKQEVNEGKNRNSIKEIIDMDVMFD